MFTEVAVTASNTDSTIYVWDIRSGSTLFSFKQSHSPKGGFALVPKRGQALETGAIITTQTDRAVLNVYGWQRDQVLHKMPTTEKMVSVAASNQGTYAAAATASGRVYLWHLATGNLVRIFEAHYRRITRLAFTSDDQALITASEDATVNVWLMAQLLMVDDEFNDNSSRPAPLYSWSDHTLPVTDIHLGHGGLNTTRVYTSAMDHTVKLWDLATGQLLTTFLFPKAVTTVCVHPAETMLFAACEDKIYSVELYRRREQQTYDAVESVGGMGKVESVGVKAVNGALESSSGSSSLGAVFVGHTGVIHSLSLSFDGSLLISGSEDGNCIVWDVSSRQPIRKFESHKGPVTHVACILKPMELLAGAGKQMVSPLVWKPFKRAVVSEDEERRTGSEQYIRDTSMDLRHHQQLSEAGPLYTSLPSETEKIHQVENVLRQLETQDSSTALRSQITGLQAELVRLHEHHNKYKALHNETYNLMVDAFMKDRRQQHPSSSHE
ncbi:quinon protein alcohol dehydrogenase-like superfamily [Radiomyces spectabilis]|uniref:quinon protein alcohol dehydrogenase-like superfamily n=1 Tax=Radiomyces spectabilis TaxID=64574 RepID=UPI00221E88F8|nr:quinon protein alcohol dehydrogenase-like superfamily [Radiomyces spectabilis]KAI8364741.1 quinon protein alcohol dehydrogenase-like superfamily [Radiomyces spectabilis]